ncbi:MAG: hypothetical protein IOD12_15530 [Silvanigrellales bacterium]|nr:hypothetical protein [Silvanigrellales bacterium]
MFLSVVSLLHMAMPATPLVLQTGSFTLAQARPRSRSGIEAPPKEKAPVVEDAGNGILPPEETGLHGKDVETPLERRRRLEEAGIVAPPPERKRVLAPWEKIGEALLSETQDTAGEPLPIGFRIDSNFGSWTALKAPSQTRYVPDFSYGFSILFPLGMPVKGPTGRTRSFFLGPSAVFYNGGTFQVQKNAYGGESDVYADTNVTEAGVDLLLAEGMPLTRYGLLSAEARVTYAPLRQVRAVYETQTQTPVRSEVGSHTRLNWYGVGLGVSAVFHLARTVGVGPFLSVSFASPTQAKLRMGLQVLFTSTHPGAPPLPPPSEDPTTPSAVLKGTRFDKPTGTSVVAPNGASLPTPKETP